MLATWARWRSRARRYGVCDHRIAEKHPELPNIVTVIADTGQRYLSGELFGEGSDVAEPDRDHELDPDTVGMLRQHRDRLEFIS